MQIEKVGDDVVDGEPVARYRQPLEASAMLHDVSKRTGLPVCSVVDYDLDGEGTRVRMIRLYRAAETPLSIEFPDCATRI